MNTANARLLPSISTDLMPIPARKQNAGLFPVNTDRNFYFLHSVSPDTVISAECRQKCLQSGILHEVQKKGGCVRPFPIISDTYHFIPESLQVIPEPSRNFLIISSLFCRCHTYGIEILSVILNSYFQAIRTRLGLHFHFLFKRAKFSAISFDHKFIFAFF